MRRREAGASERGQAPAPLSQKSPHIPARGDRLAVTASRPGARTPSRPSSCHCRHISPSTPAPACAWFGPRASVIPADSARSAPHTRTAGGSRHLRARARPSPAPRRHAHVTARFQGVDRVFVTWVRGRGQHGVAGRGEEPQANAAEAVREVAEGRRLRREWELVEESLTPTPRRHRVAYSGASLLEGAEERRKKVLARRSYRCLPGGGSEARVQGIPSHPGFPWVRSLET